MTMDTEYTGVPGINHAASTPRDRAINAIAKDEVQATPPIPHALSLIHAQLTGFKVDVDRIEDKIAGIMGPDYTEPSPTADEKLSRPENSEMVSILNDFAGTISNLRARLDGIMSRVEL